MGEEEVKEVPEEKAISKASRNRRRESKEESITQAESKKSRGPTSNEACSLLG